MRLFVAITLNDDIRNSLADLQDYLIHRGVRGNYTSLENLHLTLAFIGEYPDAADVLTAMDSVSFRPFPLKLDGIGSFNDLWWIGLSASEQLDAVVRRLRHALSDADIPFDRKRFSPHITLIRRAVYTGKGRFPPVQVPPAEMLATRISLMRSDRGRQGMIYTELGYRDAIDAE